MTIRWISTRGNHHHYSTLEAIQIGLAPDGGLFIPDAFPKPNHLFNSDIADFAAEFLKPFFADSNIELQSVCKKAFNFELPLKTIDDFKVLELFHGPTLAFKDFAARFLAEISDSLPNSKTVLVATSGDTGGAIASAFHNKANTKVFILYPQNKISKRQEKQLTSFGSNVTALSVLGNFDDCQALVKQAFSDSELKKINLISANSINIARILPQAIYYAHTSLQQPDSTFIIPTGNLGNAVAAHWAMKMGYPIKKIIFACNQNSTLMNYFKTGNFNPQNSISTLANAMDVGSPSNFERLKYLYPTLDELKKVSECFCATDEDIKNQIKTTYNKFNYIICPHTATAFYAKEKVNEANCILVSTAHPSKFETIVEPIIKKTIQIPESLQFILNKPSNSILINNSFTELKKILS